MYNLQGEWEETIVRTLSDKHNKILYDTWLLKHIIILKDSRMKTQQQLLCLYFMLFIVYELLKIFIMHFYANVNTNTCMYVYYMYVICMRVEFMNVNVNMNMAHDSDTIYVIVTDSRRLSGGACA